MSLVFSEATHTYTWAGQVVPSVTGILRPLSDYSRINPEVLEIARDRGTRVHLATELDDAGNLDEASVTDDVAPYLAAWRKFKADRGVVVLEAEARVYHGAHRYAGTLDRVLGLDDGHEYLCDLKATAQIMSAVGPQTAAYHAAYGVEKLRRAVLQLKADGTYRWVELKNPRDWIVFQACLLVHRFKQESSHV